MIGSQVSEIWIQTDEADDVACSVRHALRCLQFTKEDDLAWKWVLLALHAALQGACVCHLTGTAQPLGAVTKANTIDWIAYFESSRTGPTTRPPKTVIMPLPDLLKAIRKPLSAGNGSNSSGVSLTDAELAWLKRIHQDVRNQFTHFAPMGWSIDVSGIPEVGRLIARLVREMLEIGWAFRQKDDEWKITLIADLTLLSA